jgi:hypothetical protein
MQMADDPSDLGPEAAAHVAECLLCRAWQQQLIKIEHNVRLLPTPSSSPQAFLDQHIFQNRPAATPPTIPMGRLAEERPATLPMSSPTARPTPRWRQPRWLATVAGGLAAAGILIACGIFLGNMLSRALRDDGDLVVKNDKSPSPAGKKDVALDAPKAAPQLNPLVAKLLESDLQLAEADTPRQRVEQLARIAGALDGETTKYGNVRAGAELDRLAKLYGKVIQDGVVARARTLPREERRAVLTGIADQLDKSSKRAEAGAREAMPETAGSLRQVAVAARTGAAQLRELMEEVSE